MSELKKFLDASYHKLELFRETAPGSFKHCKNVAGLVEAIALELKLDVDMLSVSALYHDIGKCNAPMVFSENQDEDNIHDNIEPSISYQLITRHVGDSILCLLNLEDMPRQVLEIISQHHGNTVLSAIFKKSKSKSDEKFRYRNKTPQTLEASILMIADQVEAKAKSFFNDGNLKKSDDRRTLIDEVIQHLIDDDQLDIMRVGDLKVIKRVLVKELESVYHKRVDYSEEDEEKVKSTKKKELTI